MGFFEKLKASLAKTRESLQYAFSEKLDDEFYDGLTEKLILADAGASLADEIANTARAEIVERRITKSDEGMAVVVDTVAKMMLPDAPMRLDGTPAVILMIGVNGAGKTTSAGKLAAYYRRRGKSVLLAAADTFRAAAIEQLIIWGERSGCEVIKNKQGSDGAAVIFDAVSAARARGVDMVICDTAGRLHNKKNLMDELAKMARIINKAAPDASVETLLVIDGVTGRNAINQAAEFADSAGVDGIVLTKLDGTARGGSVLSVKHELGIPVRFIGIGEQLDDLDEFDAAEYARALFL